MLDKFKKLFNVVDEREPSMGKETTQAPVLADNTAELASVQAALASQAEAFTATSTQLAAAQTTIAELTSRFAEATASLAAVEAAKTALIKSAHDTKMAARKERVEAVAGTIKGALMLSATESLDDATFESICAAMSTTLNAEATSAAFTETGVTTEAQADDATQVHFKNYIKTNKE